MILVNTTDGVTVATSPSFVQDFIRYLVKQDLTYDTSKITYSEFTSIFIEAAVEYELLLGSNNPDLSGFHKSGAKLLSWQGLADNLTGSNSTVNYRQWVDKLMGGSEAVDKFYRLFLVPGVNHCGGGYGPVPSHPLDALVAWVETGTVPHTLAAEFVDVKGETVTHDICRYPLVSKYVGGDPKLAESYICAETF
jgi:hypothetical protein